MANGWMWSIWSRWREPQRCPVSGSTNVQAPASRRHTQRRVAAGIVRRTSTAPPGGRAAGASPASTRFPSRRRTGFRCRCQVAGRRGRGSRRGDHRAGLVRVCRGALRRRSDLALGGRCGCRGAPFLTAGIVLPEAVGHQPSQQLAVRQSGIDVCQQGSQLLETGMAGVVDHRAQLPAPAAKRAQALARKRGLGVAVGDEPRYLARRPARGLLDQIGRHLRPGSGLALCRVGRRCRGLARALRSGHRSRGRRGAWHVRFRCRRWVLRRRCDSRQRHGPRLAADRRGCCRSPARAPLLLLFPVERRPELCRRGQGEFAAAQLRLEFGMARTELQRLQSPVRRAFANTMRWVQVSY